MNIAVVGPLQTIAFLLSINELKGMLFGLVLVDNECHVVTSAQS